MDNHTRNSLLYLSSIAGKLNLIYPINIRHKRSYITENEIR